MNSTRHICNTVFSYATARVDPCAHPITRIQAKAVTYETFLPYAIVSDTERAGASYHARVLANVEADNFSATVEAASAGGLVKFSQLLHRVSLQNPGSSRTRIPPFSAEGRASTVVSQSVLKKQMAERGIFCMIMHHGTPEISPA